MSSVTVSSARGAGRTWSGKSFEKTYMFVMSANGLNVAGWRNVDHQGYALHGMMRSEGLRQDGSQSAKSRTDA